MKLVIKKIILPVFISFCCIGAGAQNPIIRNQYSADPSARVFGNRLYLYPSHDILATEGKGRIGWFCMEDYHVFSSSDLSEWTDHGMILTQNKVPWVKSDSYSMWAPDCVERNGKYYFYFPSTPKDTVTYGRGFGIGVAIADQPTGPFVPQAEPIKNVKGIDPNVFIDKDGQAYLYWSAGNIYGAKLKANLLELDGDVNTLGSLPTKGLKEGPFLFERNGIYYLTYPHVENKIERLEYATASNPLGPFTVKGVIMDESESGCWTNHHSLVQFKGQWYLFYHDRDYSPGFDKARSVRADSLFFNADGSIRKVIPTLRGIGVTRASSEIQLDRYSSISKEGVSVSFVDTANRFAGWKTVFNQTGGWVQYNTVDFGAISPKTVLMNTLSEKGGSLEIHTGSADGPLIAKMNITPSNSWVTTKFAVTGNPKNIQHLVVVSQSNQPVSVNWIRFQ